ncbi:hypothetical protein C8F04DRAFT_1187577 [Mycena alexandri]|uniref:Uncharacterized protein n=1 Tax=Mycena alexandri TaxID=1745969 RepID=A0AAD6SKB1_9AGAR|nr:hypothetical protein C8F04DRAFT_1187577 [Mycena alexandri]
MLDDELENEAAPQVKRKKQGDGAQEKLFIKLVPMAPQPLPGPLVPQNFPHRCSILLSQKTPILLFFVLVLVHTIQMLLCLTQKMYQPIDERFSDHGSQSGAKDDPGEEGQAFDKAEFLATYSPNRVGLPKPTKRETLGMSKGMALKTPISMEAENRLLDFDDHDEQEEPQGKKEWSRQDWAAWEQEQKGKEVEYHPQVEQEQEGWEEEENTNREYHRKKQGERKVRFQEQKQVERDAVFLGHHAREYKGTQGEYRVEGDHGRQGSEHNGSRQQMAGNDPRRDRRNAQLEQRGRRDDPQQQTGGERVGGNEQSGERGQTRGEDGGREQSTRDEAGGQQMVGGHRQQQTNGEHNGRGEQRGEWDNPQQQTRREHAGAYGQRLERGQTRGEDSGREQRQEPAAAEGGGGVHRQRGSTIAANSDLSWMPAVLLMNGITMAATSKGGGEHNNHQQRPERLGDHRQSRRHPTQQTGERTSDRQTSEHHDRQQQQHPEQRGECEHAKSHSGANIPSDGQEHVKDQSYNLLQRHHPVNRPSKPPTNSKLETHRQKQVNGNANLEEDIDTNDEDLNEEAHEHDEDDEDGEEPNDKVCKTRTANPGSGQDPTKEVFYPSGWVKVLGVAKDLLALDLLLVHFYPYKEMFIAKPLKNILDSAVVYCEEELSLRLPHHWAALEQRRHVSRLYKTKAEGVVLQCLNEKLTPQLKEFEGHGYRQADLAAKAKEKIAANGRTNNWMASSISELIYRVLYVGKRPLVKQFPKEFEQYSSKLVLAMGICVTYHFHCPGCHFRLLDRNFVGQKTSVHREIPQGHVRNGPEGYVNVEVG